MYNIKYTALNYYHSPVSDECLCVGVLFHNVTSGKRDFKYISNFQRFHYFDDEADIDFVKLYLRGIQEEIEYSLFNYKKEFDLDKYIKEYANEFRFSAVKSLNVDEDEDYILELTNIYLKYDLPKSQRLNENEEKKLIKRILEDNHLNYSTHKINGLFNDEIKFDFQVGDMYVKFFSFKEKNLKRIVGNARQWSFAAYEVGNEKEVLFIYDVENEDTENLDIIINILSEHAKVLKLDEGITYILEKHDK